MIKSNALFIVNGTLPSPTLLQVASQ